MITGSEDVHEIYRPGVLHRMSPVGNGAPLVFDIPRSGSDYPPFRLRLRRYRE